MDLRCLPWPGAHVELVKAVEMKNIKFGSVEIGPGHPPYIIAEVGSNHNGDMNLCRHLIDAAADAGAHAVKFQSWTDKSLIAVEEYARNTEYSDKKKHFGSLREMVTAYQLTADQHLQAHAHCKARALHSALVLSRWRKLICLNSWMCHFSRLPRWTLFILALSSMRRANSGR